MFNKSFNSPIVYPKYSKKNIEIKKVQFKDIDYRDSFFDSLRSDYIEFDEWFIKKSSEKQDAYVVESNNKIEAMMAYKEEKDENSELILKIRICKSNVSIYFLEWVIFKAIEYSIDTGIRKIYFTKFLKKDDKLVDIAKKFGFDVNSSKNTRGENIFIKYLKYDETKSIEYNFPYISFNKNILYHLVPIKKEYADGLFPTNESPDLFNIIHSSKEGNAIEKIYLCAAQNNKIKKGHIVFFYESRNDKKIVAIGTVIDVLTIKNIEDFKKYSNRSVFSEDDVNNLLKQHNQQLLCFSFVLSKYLDIKLPRNISVPQSISEITKEEFNLILKEGDLCKLLYQSKQNI